MTNGRRIITVIAIALFAVVIGVVGVGYLYNAQHATTTTTPTRTTTDYSALFTKKYPSLIGSDASPIFTISAVKKLADNWYSVTIVSKQNGDTLRALVLDSTQSTDGMSIVLGPSVAFNQTDVPSDVFLPETVYQEFVQ